MSYLDNCSDIELFEKFFYSFNFDFSFNDVKSLGIADENLILIKNCLQNDINLSNLDNYTLFVIKGFVLNLINNPKFIMRADDDEDLFFASAKVIIDRLDNLILERRNLSNSIKRN